jgi:hypothetical protein
VFIDHVYVNDVTVEHVKCYKIKSSGKAQSVSTNEKYLLNQEIISFSYESIYKRKNVNKENKKE